jgi:phage anti-repressor protein
MNALVPVFMHEIAGQQVQAVNLRELHVKLGSVRRDFSTWFKERTEKYGFVENRDYVTHEVVGRNGKTSVDYYATLTMAKELAMVENRPSRPPSQRRLLLGLPNGDTDDFATIELLPFCIIEQPPRHRKRIRHCRCLAGH